MPSLTTSVTAHPSWLDRRLFPFTSRWFDSADGRMHYVDEGSGEPVLFVHGTPTWSFLYRHLIRRAAARHRAIAVDHLGFGLSDKPPLAPYAPNDHARRLVALIDALDLRGVTLVVHDFGGPIGLAAALERPDRIARLVLFNTWLWDLGDDRAIARGARIAGSRMGRVLYRRLNFPVGVLMPAAFKNRRALTQEVHRHYAAPLATPDDRNAAWHCARALLGSATWFESLWRSRERLHAKPMLLLWGLGDPAFGPPYLERWRREFASAFTHTFADCGHFVPEEAAAHVGPIIDRFLELPTTSMSANPAAGSGRGATHR